MFIFPRVIAGLTASLIALAAASADAEPPPKVEPVTIHRYPRLFGLVLGALRDEFCGDRLGRVSP